MFFRQLTFDKKRLKILIMVNLTKTKEFFNKLAFVTMLAGSVLSFNSCGDKEQIHGDNPVDPIVQPDKPNTPSVTDERLHTIGNGNYQFRSFMYGANKDEVASSLRDAESHINVLLGNFSDSFKNNYSDAFDLVKENGAFKLDESAGIDFTINRINLSCKPFFAEITKNLNTTINQRRLYLYYLTLTNEAYRNGCENEFNNSNQNFNQEYDDNKAKIQAMWNNWKTDFDINYDGNGLTNDSATNITDNLDKLLLEASTNMNNGTTQSDLRNIINISFTVDPLNVVHDLTKEALHTNCVKNPESLLDTIYDNITLNKEQNNQMSL